MRVWAPNAVQVSLVCQRRKVAMTPDETGWWLTEEEQVLPDGSDYGFEVDGEGPFPDPRSAWQPQGVHGLSRVVDHSRYRWHDQHWRALPFASAVVYEVHIGTFTPEGTFSAAIERLDHLLALGITHVELMPLAEFCGAWGWGYDGVALYAPHHHYGEPEDLKRLVDACHHKGLAVLLDVVYNHLGPSGNYLEKYGPYFTHHYETPWGKAVNFDDYDSDEVRRFFLDNALMWLQDYHFDGLRLNGVQTLFDRSAIHFLRQLSAEVAQLQALLARPLVVIAASDANDPRLIRPVEQGGYGLHCLWSDDFHHALHALLTGERLGYYVDFGGIACLAKALTAGFVLDGCYSQYRRRNHGDRPEGLSGQHFLVYAQNHDQIGNRYRGERSSHLLSVGQLKISAALVLTSGFVPMLFQGEEWAARSPFLYFTNHTEKALAAAIKSGRHEQSIRLGWTPSEIPDPQAPSNFHLSKLDWEEPHHGEHRDMLEWHRQLLRLRKYNRHLTSGDLRSVEVDFDEEQQWLIVRRGEITVVCNFAQTQRRITRPDWLTQQCLLHSHVQLPLYQGELTLPGHSVAILSGMQVP